MSNGTNERMDRIEAALDRLMALTVQTAERQSTTEHHIDQLTTNLNRLGDNLDRLGTKVDRLSDTVEKIVIAVAADGENIRALARIADAHQHRIQDLENRPPS